MNLSQHTVSIYIMLAINCFILFVYFNTVVLTNGYGTFNTIRIGLSDRVKIQEMKWDGKPWKIGTFEKKLPYYFKLE